MVRTLSFVAVLALLAGLSVGFFVAEARATAVAGAEDVPLDPVVEQKVRLYVARYGLDEAAAQEVRGALTDYDRALLDLLRQLRARHKDDFRALTERANARIDAVLRAQGR